MVHRHIAWLTALRHAMRKEKPWEVFRESRTNREWLEMIDEDKESIPEPLVTIYHVQM